MRDGKILVENNPKKLIESYGVETLEDVLLEVCRHPEEVVNHVIPRENPTKIPNKSCPDALVVDRCCMFAPLRRIKTLLFKERFSHLYELHMELSIRIHSLKPWTHVELHCTPRNGAAL